MLIVYICEAVADILDSIAEWRSQRARDRVRRELAKRGRP